jgi:Fe/S biogenesis protein NfuA
MLNIEVTEGAQGYLAELLEKQNVEGVAVRLFVTQPGTTYAETCLAYCRPDEVNAEDEVMQLDLVRFYIEKNSIPYLDEAFIDYATDRMGGQLTIKAPNAKVPKVSADSPIDEQINYILYSEVNPGLASHGGEVKLEEVSEEEAGLIEKVPGLVGVRDVTDHSQREQAYYK